MKLLLAIAFVVSYGCYVVWMVTRDRYSIVMLLPGFVGGFVMRGLARRQQNYTAEISIANHLSAAAVEGPAASIHQYVVERTLIVAALLDRAGSEQYLRDHEIPAGSEIIARQRQNQFLMKTGAWQKLERSRGGAIERARSRLVPGTMQHGRDVVRAASIASVGAPS